MQSLGLAADLMARRPGLDEEMSMLVETVGQDAARLRTVARQFMEIARMSPSALQLVHPSHVLQIFLRFAVQNQFSIRQRVVVDEVIQFCPLRHSDIQRILDPGAINGNFAPIPE